MTNAEKYEEVFGMEVNQMSCPTKYCEDCPLHTPMDVCKPFNEFWDSEYKGVTNGTEDADQ